MPVYFCDLKDFGKTALLSPSKNFSANLLSPATTSETHIHLFTDQPVTGTPFSSEAVMQSRTDRGSALRELMVQ